MRKKMIIWRLNNMILKNQWVNEEVTNEIKKYLETNDNENITYKIYGMQQKRFLEGCS